MAAEDDTMQAGATETNDADEPEEESLFFVEADEVLGLITSFSDPEKTAAAHAAAAERAAAAGLPLASPPPGAPAAAWPGGAPLPSGKPPPITL